MEFSLNQVMSAERAAMEWLCNSYSHGKGGFPHSRWMYLPSPFAWQGDYAETTGYLIENLLDFNAGVVPGLSKMAEAAGSWLIHIQSKEGYFHSGTQFKKPSAFNTAQIIFGLDVLYTKTRNEKYFRSMSDAFHWLIEAMNEDGKCEKGLYVSGYYAAYYARALWPLMLIDQKYFNSTNESKLLTSLNYLYSCKNPEGFFNNMEFYPGKAASLHTVAYTLEGFYECSRLSGLVEMRMYIVNILDRIGSMIQKHQKTPAHVYPDFKADFSFVCITGQAQLCALYLKLYSDLRNPVYKDIAVLLFKQLLNWQIKSDSAEHNGALPSSMPVWKNYFPLRYTNWTMKFFLDACGLMKEVI